MPKYMIVGHGRHGKDTVADYVAGFLGCNSISSSYFACREVIYPQFTTLFQSAPAYVAKVQQQATYRGHESARKYLYDTRFPYRAEWKSAICEYNEECPHRLMGELFQLADIYVGCRSLREFESGKTQALFDLSIWVDASERVDSDDETCEIRSKDCDLVIENNSSLSDLYIKVQNLCDVIGGSNG